MLVILLTAITGMTQTLDGNLVKTTIARSPVKTETDLDNLLPEKKNISVSYFDGLGRKDQTIIQKASPLGNDIIQPVYYDEFGRNSKMHLPYTDGQQSGEYREHAWLYSEYFYSNPPDRIAKSYHSYWRNYYDNSPLNRVAEEKPNGQFWYSHKIKHNLKVNTLAEEIKKIKCADSNFPVTLGISSGIHYATGELIINETIDEDGNTVKEYINKKGQVILKKTDLTATYYVYDDFGLLRAVIPPLAVNELINQGWFFWGAMLDLIYYYDYDQRHRLIQKKIPGSDGYVSMVYDKRDRLVLTQDGNLRENDEWLFFKYDALNRPTISGIYKLPNCTTQVGMQTNLDNFYSAHPDSYFEEPTDVAFTTYWGYTNQSFPNVDPITGNGEFYTVTYYDDYDYNFDGTDDVQYTVDTDINSLPFYRLKGKITGQRVRILNDGFDFDWELTSTFYDDRSRAIQTKKAYLVGSTTNSITDYILSSTEYDFVGQAIKSKTSYSFIAPMTFSEDIIERFEYDPQGRLLRAYHKINNQDEILMTENSYNEIGQLVEKNLHHTVNTCGDPIGPFQSVDYSYNIRGWLTHINNEDLSDDSFINGCQYNPSQKTQSYLVGQYRSCDIAGIQVSFSEQLMPEGHSIIFATIEDVKSKNVRNLIDTTDSPFTGNASRTISLVRNDVVSTTAYAEVKSILTETIVISLSSFNLSKEDFEGDIVALYDEIEEDIHSAGLTNQEVMDNINRVIYDFYDEDFKENNGYYVYQDAELYLDGISFELKHELDSATEQIVLETSIDQSIQDSRETNYFEFTDRKVIKERLLGATDSNFDNLLLNINSPVSVSYTNLEVDLDAPETSLSGISSDIYAGMAIEYTGNIDPCDMLCVAEEVVGFVINQNNQQALTNDDDNDLFGMEILYNEPFNGYPNYEQKGNGNIAAIKWSSHHFNDGKRAYGFNYDNINRLTTSTFRREGATDYVLDQGYYDTRYQYDKNGNIEELEREGFIGIIPINIDYLFYSYSGNQLQAVDDISTGDNVGFVDNAELTTEYFYDANGNLTEDKNKRITSIEYNHLNLPKKIEFAAGSSSINRIEYIYNALGEKVFKKTTKIQPVIDDISMKYYLGGIELYTEISNPGNWIETIHTPEGRLVPSATQGEFDYEYYLKDHLGNIRVVFSTTSMSSGYPAVVMEDHYYPFGLQMGQLHYDNPAFGNSQYKYNGKELQDDAFDTDGINGIDTKLDWYDYGARMYDPTIGRWQVVDPMANNAYGWSPYNAMWCNPILNTDPDGRWADKFEYTFNEESGAYEFTNRVAEAGPHYAVVIDQSGEQVSGRFYFSDQEIVEQDYKTGAMNKFNLDYENIIYSPALENVMEISGVNNPDNGFWYAKEESPQKGKMDYATKYLKDNTVYARGMYVYNKGDFGNYLWGQGMHRLGIGLEMSMFGAQVNNWKDWIWEGLGIKSSVGKSNYGGVEFWDSDADQGAIMWGWYNY
ncbi:MAG: DUF6443 domain-containing protein [Bacteroidales bacterium]|nr:DUF6443 domain-containing protein [Bacteroidales bacterium]